MKEYCFIDPTYYVSFFEIDINHAKSYGFVEPNMLIIHLEVVSSVSKI